MRGEDVKILDALLVKTVPPGRVWPPDQLVSVVKKEIEGKVQEKVSSAEVKGAIWRLAADRRLSLTRERQVASAESDTL